MQKESYIKTKGQIVSEYKRLTYPVGICSFEVSGDFSVKLYFKSRPIVIFAKGRSKVTINSKELLYNQLQYIPQGNKVEISTKYENSSFTILLLSKKIIEETIANFDFNSKQFKNYFSSLFRVPLKTWSYEILYRYEFERKAVKYAKSIASNFLEQEIVKEIYCTFHEEQNTFLKYKFGLTKESLEGKSVYVQNALEYIQENIFKKINITELCKISHASKATLIRHFKNDLGITPLSYVRRQKLNVIDSILKTSTISVSEAAELIGYDNPSEFIRAFKNRFGYTPGAAAMANKVLENL